MCDTLERYFVKSVDYKGHEIKVYIDPDPSSPIGDWCGMPTLCHARGSAGLLGMSTVGHDNLMAWIRSEYEIECEHVWPSHTIFAEALDTDRGDVIDDCRDDCGDCDACQAAIAAAEADLIMVPIYLADIGSSGWIVRESDKPWREIKCWAYVSKSDADWQGMSEDQILDAIKQSIKVVRQWCDGEIYGYQVEGPECEDSCWGFYGDDGIECMIGEAKAAIDHGVEYSEVRAPYCYVGNGD
jgi:hypothetical protein